MTQPQFQPESQPEPQAQPKPKESVRLVSPFQEPVAQQPAPQPVVITSEAMASVTRELAGIPDFEGKEVEVTAAKITSVAALEINDAAWKMDEYVRMVIEGRVVKVEHTVNEKTGKLARIHTVKAVDSKVLGWGDSA